MKLFVKVALSVGEMVNLFNRRERKRETVNRLWDISKYEKEETKRKRKKNEKGGKKKMILDGDDDDDDDELR